MQVILLEDIANLGVLGEQVNVKSGFGRNFLIPQNKAVAATSENVEKFEERRAELQKTADEKLAAAKVRATGVEALEVVLTTKAGDEGKLFGSITVRDIVEAAEAKGVTLEKVEVKMPDGPIRELGDFEISIHLHSEVDVILKVKVEAEEG
ncbi:MAG: 50S ribosomal protein L9 [Pseudomonadales bacterium]|nr:50S ribosomal protein L9 [Pseudomonadales bacterium]